MEIIKNFIDFLNSILWGDKLGIPLLIPLLGLVGIYLTIGLRFLTWHKLVYAAGLLWKGRHPQEGASGDISPFQALMTALSATIGTGNIAGVATAIYFGGPGAIFWMWVIALFGMATKYAEAILAVKYREVDEIGNYVGGPMYYIRNGLKKKWHWLGGAFAFFGMIAGFGLGNLVQSNSVADEIHNTFNITPWISGLIMAALVASVILGGIKRIAEVAGKVVPVMAIAYFVGALSIILLHFNEIPGALALIINSAFSNTAASGGFAGATIMMAIRWGVARGIFSNESGLGSAPIAHAAARTNDPVRQGLIAMMGTFIDTIIICSMTALVIILTGVWDSGVTGAPLSSLAFDTGLPGVGKYIVSFGILVFAFTTMLGWSYYGERCGEYLFGVKIIVPFRIAWVLAVFVGSTFDLEFVWLLADALNGLMAIPNLIALLLLSPVIFQVTRDYFNKPSEK
jgi:AGCS family alanine or glycine:cation symporter